MKWLAKLYPDNHTPSNDTPKDKNGQSFHRSIAFALILGQCFGLLPVQGITGPSERSLHFTWKSWRILYSALVLIGAGFASYMSIYEVIVYDSSIFQITAIAFFVSSFTVHILFIDLARNWSKLMRAWYIVEVSMRSYGWPPKLNVRLKTMAGVVLSIAAIEHFLVFSNNLIRAEHCKSGAQDMFEYFFVIISYPQVFSVLRYYFWAGILMQLVNLISTFSWTYIDLFIMLMSTALALRFKQVTHRVESYIETRVSDEVLWRNVREDYNRLSKLCKTMNEAISNIVLTSFGSNLFFILVQFFHSLRNRPNALEKVYFFFSFGFLIGRTICVSLYGAWIHDESQKPLPLLNGVSSAVYNIEIRRFILHICFDSVALTGKRFFNVTRGLILSIAGTIVTYELVLIQFYGNLLQNTSRANVSSLCA